MSWQTYMLFLTTGGALLAAWVVVRAPQLTPRSARGVGLGLAGIAAVSFATPHLIAPVGEPLGAPAAALLVALPACVYIFTAVAWLMLYVARALAPHVR